LRQSTKDIDRREWPIDLKIGTTFSDREVLRQFATEPDQFAAYFEIQIKTRNGNRVDGIGTFSRFGDGGVVEVAREKRPKE